MNVCLLLNEQDEMYYKLYSFTAAATACLCPIPPRKMLIIPLDSTTLSCHYPLRIIFDDGPSIKLYSPMVGDIINEVRVTKESS